MAFDTAPYLAAIEQGLQEALPRVATREGGVYDMLRYHMGWQNAAGDPAGGQHGKRLRPLLCVLACEAVGGSWRSALPAACSIELLHNFTLIHDDIEDQDRARHGRTTVWAQWGQAHGINAGDLLWAVSRGCLHGLTELGHEPRTVLGIMQLLDETCVRLCVGQYLDIEAEGHVDLTEDGYLQLIGGKTAALIEATLAAGALLGGATPDAVGQMRRFGANMGLAFQMTDDLLGIWGDPRVTGKSAASDLLAHKMTLPVILALAWERDRGERTLRDLYSAPPDSSAIPAMLAVLDSADARATTLGRARACVQAMEDSWQAMSLQGPASEGLYELAHSIIDRQL